MLHICIICIYVKIDLHENVKHINNRLLLHYNINCMTNTQHTFRLLVLENIFYMLVNNNNGKVNIVTAT